MMPLDAGLEATVLLAAAVIFGAALSIARLARWCWRSAAGAGRALLRHIRKKSISR